MASAVVEEVLDYVRSGVRLLGLTTRIDLDVVHTRGCAWRLNRQGEKQLQFICPNSTVLDEVVATVQGWGHMVELTDQPSTVLITPVAG